MNISIKFLVVSCKLVLWAYFLSRSRSSCARQYNIYYTGCNGYRLDRRLIGSAAEQLNSSVPLVLGLVCIEELLDFGGG